jgi:hypothetical protein
MKKNKQPGVIQAIVCVLFFGFFGCAGNESAVKSDLSPLQSAPVNWDRVKENTWQLVSVDKGKLINRLDHKKYEANGLKETYTLCFSGDTTLTGRIYGRGAPNIYFAMFGIGDNPAIIISSIVSTKMAAIYEPEDLKEHEYFRYLEKADRWSMDYAEHLKLSTKDQEGEEISLIFKKL